MSIIDDPVLALIARFVSNDLEQLSVSDENFLKNQVDTIYSYVKDAPKEQQQKMALHWIKEHAENYRKDWLKKTLTSCVTDSRCSDCPLIHGGNRHCSIHSKWVILLNEYLSNKISSEQYVEETLHILEQNKKDLKISRVIQHTENI